MRPGLAMCAALGTVLALSGCAEMEAAMEQATTPQRIPTQPTVAVVDTGIDASHPLLACPVDFPFGFDTLLHATQGVDHGTAVASVIAAHSRGVRIASVAWDYGAYAEWRIALESCLTGNTYGCTVAWQHATGHMIQHGDIWQLAPVVNLSHSLLSLRGTELVRRLLATADRTASYDNTYDYGAGVITAERVRQACRVPGQT